MVRFAYILMLTLLVASPGGAATIHVPGAQPTSQAGIDAAVAGDTVLVECGTYFEHPIIMKSGITLRSATGSSDCVVVDAEGQGLVVNCYQLDNSTLIEGIHFTRGSGSPGGMSCDLSSHVMRNCLFSNNTGATGAAMWCSVSSPTVIDCGFEDNTASVEGGAVYCLSDASPEFIGCHFTRNLGNASSGALFCRLGSSPTLTGCVFSDNEAPGGGGAIASLNSSLQMSGCVFSGNSSDGGGAILCQNSPATISSSTFYGNSALFGSAFYLSIGSSVELEGTVVAFGSLDEPFYCDGTSVALLSCSDVYGHSSGDWTGCIAGQENAKGNFSADPLFCDPENGDFHIQSDSPCAPPGVTDCGLVGSLPVDCGPVSVVEESWGAVKGRYVSR